MRFSAGVVICSVVTACQCGPNPMMNPPLLSPSAWCERLETAFCEDQQQCRGVSAHVVCRPGWRGFGVSTFRGCPPDLEASLDAGRVRFDGALAARCVGEPSTQCRISYPAECGRVVDGVVAVGGACTSSVDCAAGLECRGMACPGTCRLPQCTGNTVALPDGGCEASPQATTPTGGQLLSGACGATVACASGLRCDADICVNDLPAEGDACNETTRRCQQGLSCFGGVCIRGLSPGTACEFTTSLPDGGFTSPVPCAFDAFCDADKTCKSAPREGEACANSCRGAQLTCDQGVCRTPLSEGASCARNTECRSRQCLAGRCTPACSLF